MASSGEPVDPTAETFTTAPDPGQARTLDDLAEQLRLLKVWAGDPSYERIKDRINGVWRASGRPTGELVSKTTVVSCFRSGRRRLNPDLVVAIVQALHPDVGYVAQWRQALRVIGGEIEAAAQVRVQDTLPPDLAEFTGRAPELDQLRQALHHAQHDGGAVVITAIEGMAGVGKTQLAVHCGHLLLREYSFERVLFVNLRGFHPDPAQPPADPAAVLDGFLRLLGVPGQQIPHDLAARTAAYRRRLAGTRALVVLDNATDAAQVRPLLADTPGCLTLVTSRRSLTDLQPATRLAVDVFTPDEAIDFLTRAVPDVPVGADPHAAARIAARCGHLPLALSLGAGHIRSTPGWTLTDHADRLDERHHHRQLDSGVTLTLNLSYQHLHAEQQRLLRLAASHPGQDFDAYAAAAMTDTDLATVQDRLHQLCRDHLLQQPAPGRYSFHDLVRAYAADRASDHDTPQQRRIALTHLFDFYLATAAAAVEIAYPYGRLGRSTRPPADVTVPELADRNQAELWFDTELANLLAVAQYSAAHDWPAHTWQLSAVLDRHLHTRGRFDDAQTLHQHGLDLARQLGDQLAEVNALNGLGYIHRRLGHHEQAGDYIGRALQIAQAIRDHSGELNALVGLGHLHWILGHHDQADDEFERALQIAKDIGDRGGEHNALYGLGMVNWAKGHYKQAEAHLGQALQIAQDIGDRTGEQQVLYGLGDVHRMMGEYEPAGEHYDHALRIAHEVNSRVGELRALHGLGAVQFMLGRYEQAEAHLERALQMAQEIGDRTGELNAVNGLGQIYRSIGRHSQAVDCYRHVFELGRELGSRNWQFEGLQGLGRLHHAAGRPDLALINHGRALQFATDLAQPADQARAHDGLAHAHRTLNQHERARHHWQHALEILTGLGTDQTEEPETSVPNIRDHLTSLVAFRGSALG